MAAAPTAQREWARLGAHARLMAIESERLAILKAFPDLARGGGVSHSVNGHVAPKRRFSMAARRRMSEGMRKFWARRKADAKTKAKSA